MPKRFAVLPIAAAIVAVAAHVEATRPQPTPSRTIVTFKATLSSANEVPANTSTGTGTFTATLDTSTNVFTYDVTVQRSDVERDARPHPWPGPGRRERQPGAQLCSTLPGGTFTTGAHAGSAHGTVTLNAATTITATINGDSLKKLLFAGQTYANIHTTHESAAARSAVRSRSSNVT